MQIDVKLRISVLIHDTQLSRTFLLYEHPTLRAISLQSMNLYASKSSAPSAGCRSFRSGYAQHSCNADPTADMCAESSMNSLLKHMT